MYLDFSKQRILIIGDIMLDHYIYGEVNRISPEAPVPIVAKDRSDYHLGGAGNVAINIQSLGALPILISISGDDPQAEIIEQLIESSGIQHHYLKKIVGRKTTVKTRIVASGQQLLRIDHEDIFDISEEIEKEIFGTVKDLLIASKVDAIIFQDYNKGLLTESLIQSIVALADIKNIPMIVDPKNHDYSRYKGTTLIKPNKHELSAVLGMNIDPHELLTSAPLSKLKTELNLHCIMTTLGKDGIHYLSDDESRLVKTDHINIVDVCGAGDSVVSIITCGYVVGYPYGRLAELANISGGLACSKSGIVAVSVDDIMDAYRRKYK